MDYQRLLDEKKMELKSLNDQITKLTTLRDSCYANIFRYENKIREYEVIDG